MKEEKTLDRREFTLAAAMAALSGVAITISACGGGGSPSSPTPAPTPTPAPPAGATDKTAVIGSNHGHAGTITAAQLTAGGTLSLNIQGTATHPHTVELHGGRSHRRRREQPRVEGVEQRQRAQPQRHVQLISSLLSPGGFLPGATASPAAARSPGETVQIAPGVKRHVHATLRSRGRGDRGALRRGRRLLVAVARPRPRPAGGPPRGRARLPRLPRPIGASRRPRRRARDRQRPVVRARRRDGLREERGRDQRVDSRREAATPARDGRRRAGARAADARLARPVVPAGGRPPRRVRQGRLRLRPRCRTLSPGGRDAAARLGCFACHGPQGRGDTPNPGSLKGHIPSWSGADFLELARDEGEIREWIREGAPRRLRDNPVAAFFLRRQAIRMPAYGRTRRRSGDPADHRLHPLAEA